ncbi:acid phosphatase (class A) [Sphingomonas gellani]|uniref:Acid phosphatase n=1 Tax=Sphingomonas gellani TaxID=1166340 RepID=A0A1H8DA34_9SPHN|nr:phosphatase PAP2 family protein [Sphingomonas gellani]SEN03347.1 acid phosphatase (class A) [Sphingomonas gellani]
MKRLLLATLPLVLVAADREPSPYLSASQMPDLTRILPSPPANGDPRSVDDRSTFRATRDVKNSPRWTMATRDVTDDRFTVFACAMGRTLDPRDSPALARVFARMGDGDMVGRAKRAFAVRRPYLDQPGDICEPKTAHLAGNGDYPSGHTSNGWSTALILAELMPDRATQILRRGRQYGESRFICGAHSRSAVEAGFMAGAVLVSRLHADAAFRADMDEARAELAQQRPAAFKPPANCGLENAAGG